MQLALGFFEGFCSQLSVDFVTVSAASCKLHQGSPYNAFIKVGSN